jgi:hypothetical protein
MKPGIELFGDADGASWRGQDRSRAISNAVNRLTGTVDEAIFPKARAYTRATSLRTTTTAAGR